MTAIGRKDRQSLQELDVHIKGMRILLLICESVTRRPLLWALTKPKKNVPCKFLLYESYFLANNSFHARSSIKKVLCQVMT